MTTENEACFAYYHPDLVETWQKALTDLERYIDTDGPFDGVIAFSQGASLAATLIIRSFSERQAVEVPFQCAIFFSATPAVEYAALEKGTLKQATANQMGQVIGIPTAHIHGRKDLVFEKSSQELKAMCRAELRSDFLHSGGHEIPGPGMKDDVTGAIRAINRTVTRALTES